MIKVTKENHNDIVRVYATRILDDMDMDSLYSFAYHMLVDNKEEMNMTDLEKEVKEFYPDILEDDE